MYNNHRQVKKVITNNGKIWLYNPNDYLKRKNG